MLPPLQSFKAVRLSAYVDLCLLIESRPKSEGSRFEHPTLRGACRIVRIFSSCEGEIMVLRERMLEQGERTVLLI